VNENDDDIFVFADGEWSYRWAMDSCRAFDMDYDLLRANTEHWQDFVDQLPGDGDPDFHW
jgi:hypothetical protein